MSPLLLSSLLMVRAALADDAASPIPTPEPIGAVQVWMTAYDQDTDPTADPAGYGDPEDDLGFKVRRARFGLQGEGSRLRYKLQAGASAPYDEVEAPTHESWELVDAMAGGSPVDGLWIDVGYMKAPVGRESLMSSSQLALGERSVQSEWLVPDRDAGLLATFETKGKTKARVRAGAFNGNSDPFGDTDGGLLAVGRAELVLGEGQTYRTFGVVEGVSLGVAGDGWYDVARSTTTVGYGGDVMLRVSGLAVLIEGHFSQITPTNSDLDVPGVLSETRRMGALAQVGWTAGHWEPAVRVSVFDDDRDSSDNGDVGDVLGGVTWHWKDDHVRVGGGYVLRMERGGASLANDTARLWVSLTL